MSTEAITALHRASKTAVLLWLSMKCRGLRSWWLLAVAFGMAMAVRVLVYARLVAACVIRPWPR